MLVVANFSSTDTFNTGIKIPAELIARWALPDGDYPLSNALENNPGHSAYKLKVTSGAGVVPLTIRPLESLLLELEAN